MSYDIAVWVGIRPADDEEADDRYEELMEILEEDEETPPSAAIVAYAQALTQRFPDEPDAPGNPWRSGPILADAVGDILTVNIDFERADEVVSYMGQLAAEHGLVCYDPQEGVLR
ncbi:hypothetical protein OG394_17060 [Kribbella sp. NBC_01245]|uniref:hypothetical protein n=1 Tax=Kribbella sp. NBC_01245 TaxID=2903578 RepID=UPI002E2CD14D|nr:hypothetical protein [Kribbella sp. NBC_01245]